MTPPPNDPPEDPPGGAPTPEPEEPDAAGPPSGPPPGSRDFDPPPSSVPPGGYPPPPPPPPGSGYPPPPPAGGPGGYPPPPPMDAGAPWGAAAVKPGRGGLILALGIIGLLCCSPVALVAFILGRRDMAEMDAGRMDPSTRSLTNVGRILGLIGIIWFVLQLFLVLANVGSILGTA
jgi:hypothetical protein